MNEQKCQIHWRSFCHFYYTKRWLVLFEWCGDIWFGVDHFIIKLFSRFYHISHLKKKTELMKRVLHFNAQNKKKMNCLSTVPKQVNFPLSNSIYELKVEINKTKTTKKYARIKHDLIVLCVSAKSIKLIELTLAKKEATFENKTASTTYTRSDTHTKCVQFWKRMANCRIKKKIASHSKSVRISAYLKIKK